MHTQQSLDPLTVFQMNALSADTSKTSTDSAAVPNNVYEEPQGNEGGDSEDEDTYQTPPSNKPVHEAPPTTLFLVSCSIPQRSTPRVTR